MIGDPLKNIVVLKIAPCLIIDYPNMVHVARRAPHNEPLLHWAEEKA